MEKAQQHIQRLLNEMVEHGVERGIQVAAYLDGKPVIDAWAGVADPATGRKVDGNTLFPVFSTGKGISATAIHILAEQGKIDYDTPIADCWPEFGQNGKEHITLRHALSHTAGIPVMPECRDVNEVCDWDLMCRKVAALSPLWPVGTKSFYHAITFSWIIGETARRLDGRDFNTIVQEEICRPLGIDSLFLGIPDREEARVAVLEVPELKPGEKPWQPEDPIAAQAIPASVRPLEVFMNLPQVRRACIPASNGIMSARAIACHYAALAAGEVNGVRLLSPEAIRMATTLASPPGDVTSKFALGYILSGPEEDLARVFGHGGYGGSNGFADVKNRLSIGITKNGVARSCENYITPDLVGEIRTVLGLSDR